MSFIITMTMNGKSIQINAIDVMTFNDSGKITSLKAYWGMDDMKEL